MYPNIIKIQDIQKTTPYNNAPEFLKKLLCKKYNILLIEKGFIHYNKTGEILDNIGIRNVQIMKEIIKTKKT